MYIVLSNRVSNLASSISRRFFQAAFAINKIEERETKAGLLMQTKKRIMHAIVQIREYLLRHMSLVTWRYKKRDLILINNDTI